MNRWTPDEVRSLVAYHAAGLRAAVIGKRLGRTVYGIREKARALGLRWGSARRIAHAGTLADEIEAARREAATAPLFRPGDRV